MQRQDIEVPSLDLREVRIIVNGPLPPMFLLAGQAEPSADGKQCRINEIYVSLSCIPADVRDYVMDQVRASGGSTIGAILNPHVGSSLDSFLAEEEIAQD